jgi:hypothetical protein
MSIVLSERNDCTSSQEATELDLLWRPTDLSEYWGRNQWKRAEF